MRITGHLLLLAVGICLVLGASGQCIDTYEPGCKLPAEIGYPQRHCIDPTKYWMCSGLNEQAKLYRCRTNTAFSPEKKACIAWIDWAWKPCVEPPSRPTGWQECYLN